jgi:OOP family OmpA-OmpF porin
MRWIGYSGLGTRTTASGQRVSDVSERFTRLSGMAMLTWLFPGGGAAAWEEEAETAEVVGHEIRIKSTIYFNPGSATIDLPRSRRALRAVVQVMRENPGIKVEVRGHTDNQGHAAANRELSLKRAQAVAEAMVSMAVARDRLSAQGLGESEPIASNDTDEGRAKNRRVEFRIAD